jgi:hypothetical protein
VATGAAARERNAHGLALSHLARERHEHPHRR